MTDRQTDEHTDTARRQAAALMHSIARQILSERRSWQFSKSTNRKQSSLEQLMERLKVRSGSRSLGGRAFQDENDHDRKGRCRRSLVCVSVFADIGET